MNIDGEMLPVPLIEIKHAPLKRLVFLTKEDSAIRSRISRAALKSGKGYWPIWTKYLVAERADDVVMLTRTMCPEAKPAVKDLAVFLKFSQ